TMSTYDIDRAASRASSVSSIQVKHGGTVRLVNIKTVAHKDILVAVSRSGELAIADSMGRERERYRVPYGALITAKEGEEIQGGQVVATWDPHTHPIVAEVEGRVQFGDMTENVTVNCQTDELTGLGTTDVI